MSVGDLVSGNLGKRGGNIESHECLNVESNWLFFDERGVPLEPVLDLVILGKVASLR